MWLLLKKLLSSSNFFKNMMSSSSPKPPYPVSTHLFIPHNFSNPYPPPWWAHFWTLDSPLFCPKLGPKHTDTRTTRKYQCVLCFGAKCSSVLALSHQNIKHTDTFEWYAYPCVLVLRQLTLCLQLLYHRHLTYNLCRPKSLVHEKIGRWKISWLIFVQ